MFPLSSSCPGGAKEPRASKKGSTCPAPTPNSSSTSSSAPNTANPGHPTQPHPTPEVADRLYPYIGGIVRAEKGALYDIGGIEDHVHLYLRWRPDAPISDLMRTVKARSSKWVHDTFPTLDAFAWKEGYSVFSVSKSQEAAVKKYIAGQHEHHKTQDFKAELLQMLRRHEIEFDERYVLD